MTFSDKICAAIAALMLVGVIAFANSQVPDRDVLFEVSQQYELLQDLKAEGLITEAEYNAECEALALKLEASKGF